MLGGLVGFDLLCCTSIFLASGRADVTDVRITPLSFFGLVLAAELELELIHSRMAQKPVLRVEVGARV